METLDVPKSRNSRQSRRSFLIASVTSLSTFAVSACMGQKQKHSTPVSPAQHQENMVESGVENTDKQWIEEHDTPSHIHEEPEEGDLRRVHWPAVRAALEEQRLTPKNGRAAFSTYAGPKNDKRIWGSFSVEKRYNGDVEVIIAIKITHDTLSFIEGTQHYCFDGGTIDFKIIDGNGLEIRAQTSENGTGWVIIPKDKGMAPPYQIRFPRNPKGE